MITVSIVDDEKELCQCQNSLEMSPSLVILRSTISPAGGAGHRDAGA